MKYTIQSKVIEKFHQGLSLRQISRHLNISKSYAHKIIQKSKNNDNVKKLITGRPRVFKNDDMKYLEVLLQERVDWYLDELHEEMKLWLGREISLSTIRRSVHRLGYTRKQVGNNNCMINYFLKKHL